MDMAWIPRSWDGQDTGTWGSTAHLPSLFSDSYRYLLFVYEDCVGQGSIGFQYCGQVHGKLSGNARQRFGVPLGLGDQRQLRKVFGER